MTFSVVGRCARTGQIGVAAATAVPAVGKLLIHAEAAVGAVATQARVNPYLGIDGLSFLRQRLCADDVAPLLKRADPRIEARQFAVLDSAGRASAFTGSECLPWAGHLLGEQHSVQGNRLFGRAVLEAASRAFLELPEQPLVERLLRALHAGDSQGGDRHGESSASVYVVDSEEYPLWDIRVDLHEQPIAELARLHRVFCERLLPDVLAMPTRRNPAGKSDEEDA